MTAVEQYAAVLDDYRATVDRQIQCARSLNRPDERTREFYGMCIVEILPKAEKLAEFLAQPHRKKLEELIDSFRAYEDEGGFERMTIPGLEMDHPEDTLAYFLELFRRAGA